MRNSCHQEWSLSQRARTGSRFAVAALARLAVGRLGRDFAWDETRSPPTPQGRGTSCGKQTKPINWGHDTESCRRAAQAVVGCRDPQLVALSDLEMGRVINRGPVCPREFDNNLPIVGLVDPDTHLTHVGQRCHPIGEAQPSAPLVHHQGVTEFVPSGPRNNRTVFDRPPHCVVGQELCHVEKAPRQSNGIGEHDGAQYRWPSCTVSSHSVRDAALSRLRRLRIRWAARWLRVG